MLSRFYKTRFGHNHYASVTWWTVKSYCAWVRDSEDNYRALWELWVKCATLFDILYRYSAALNMFAPNLIIGKFCFALSSILTRDRYKIWHMSYGMIKYFCRKAKFPSNFNILLTQHLSDESSFTSSPMDLIAGKSSRAALSAAFAILTSRLLRLLLQGDRYWIFPGMDDPAFAEKFSFLGSKLHGTVEWNNVSIPWEWIRYFIPQ